MTIIIEDSLWGCFEEIAGHIDFLTKKLGRPPNLRKHENDIYWLLSVMKQTDQAVTAYFEGRSVSEIKELMPRF